MPINQKVSALPSENPAGSPIAPDVDAEATAYGLSNAAVISGLLDGGNGRQSPRLSANAAEFKPSPAAVVGNLVTGMPADGATREMVIPSYLGGRSIMVAGVDNNPTVLPASGENIVDYGPPDGAGYKLDAVNRQFGIPDAE